MRKLFILIAAMLCSSCAQMPPAEIPNAPPNRAQAVVFDIDGTLTPRPLETWVARTDAAKAVNLFAGKGYKIFYLTARIKLFQGNLRDWLKEKGFPEGSLYVPEAADDDKGTADFKTRMLKDFIAHGWKVEYAYGDSITDFEAYAAAGIPKARVYALQREGETACQPGVWNACLKGWTEHIDFIMKSVPAVAAK